MNRMNGTCALSAQGSGAPHGLRVSGQVRAALALTAVAVLAAPAAADLPEYHLVGSFAVPLQASAGGAWDIMPDGRIAVMDGGQILVQDALNASTYSALGSVDAGVISSFGASFLRFSPDGSRLAIGDNNFGSSASVLIVDTAALSPAGPAPYTSVVAANLDAAWADNNTLFVNGFGATSHLSRIDADALTATMVIDGIGQGSGGIVIDGTHVYQAIGFDTSSGGEPTGQVRAFALADLLSTDIAVDYANGIAVADALSGSPLGLDAFGNLLIGGGDFFAGSNDFGYAAVVDGDAILLALAGAGMAPDEAELRLSPAGANAAYSIAYNRATDELLVIAEGTAYRYAVPAPGAATALGIAVLLCGRRRR